MNLHEETQLLAYFLWQERGCPCGTPEVDWFRAEHRLRQQNNGPVEEPLLVAAAKKIGSVLGSVVGAVDAAVDR